MKQIPRLGLVAAALALVSTALVAQQQTPPLSPPAKAEGTVAGKNPAAASQYRPSRVGLVGLPGAQAAISISISAAITSSTSEGVGFRGLRSGLRPQANEILSTARAVGFRNVRMRADTPL